MSPTPLLVEGHRLYLAVSLYPLWSSPKVSKEAQENGAKPQTGLRKSPPALSPLCGPAISCFISYYSIKIKQIWLPCLILFYLFWLMVPSLRQSSSQAAEVFHPLLCPVSERKVSYYTLGIKVRGLLFLWHQPPALPPSLQFTQLQLLAPGQSGLGLKYNTFRLTYLWASRFIKTPDHKKQTGNFPTEPQFKQSRESLLSNLVSCVYQTA